MATEDLRIDTPCPSSPNCVSSMADDEKHFVEKFSYQISSENLRAKLKVVLASYPRTTLVRESDDDLHYTFTSGVMGYVDDVIFWFDHPRKELHFRSSSRVGYWDLGANRRRIEGIRRDLSRALDR